MKFLRLSLCLLAPGSMILLGYLFLLPRNVVEPVRSGVIALVILDPVDPAIADAEPAIAPILSRLRQNGLRSTIAGNGAASIDEAIREILTGNPQRRLNNPTMRLNRTTYRLETVSPWERSSDPDLLEILPGFNRKIKLMTGSESVTDEDFTGSGTDVIICHIPRSTLSDREYLTAVETRLATFAETVNTWFVVSPMHRRLVIRRFHVNQWLLGLNQLVRQTGGPDTNGEFPQDGIDFTSSSAFFTGNGESGLRINREMTYESGTVMRTDYERIRKELASELRNVTIPGTGIDPGPDEEELPLFTGIFRGEQIFTSRREGQFPDLVWETDDAPVMFDAALLPDPDDSPWQPVAETADDIRAGGWIVIVGPAFDTEIRDLTEMKGVTAADIAPTMLFLLAHPVAKDMQGRVLQQLMTSVMQERAPATVDSYSYHDPLVEQEF